MRIKYLQRRGVTVILLGEKDRTWVGLARTRPGDKFNASLGIAVALIKAEDSAQYRRWLIQKSATIAEFGAMKAIWSISGWNVVELTDSGTVAWAKLWHEYRLALRSVEEKRVSLARGFVPIGLRMTQNDNLLSKKEAEWLAKGVEEGKLNLERFLRLPSDGQIAETFGLRLLKEIGEPPFVKKE